MDSLLAGTWFVLEMGLMIPGGATGAGPPPRLAFSLAGFTTSCGPQLYTLPALSPSSYTQPHHERHSANQCEKPARKDVPGHVTAIGIPYNSLQRMSPLPLSGLFTITLLLAASFPAGVLLALADINAILFCACLFPDFADPGTPRVVDVAAILAITVVTAGGIHLAHAFAARMMVGWLHGAMSGASGSCVLRED